MPCTCSLWYRSSAEPGHKHRGNDDGCTVEGCYCESTKK